MDKVEWGNDEAWYQARVVELEAALNYIRNMDDFAGMLSDDERGMVDAALGKQPPEGE